MSDKSTISVSEEVDGVITVAFEIRGSGMRIGRRYEQWRELFARINAAHDRAKQGLPAVYGKWPGDETDEQIDAALRHNR